MGKENRVQVRVLADAKKKFDEISRDFASPAEALNELMEVFMTCKKMESYPNSKDQMKKFNNLTKQLGTMFEEALITGAETYDSAKAALKRQLEENEELVKKLMKENEENGVKIAKLYQENKSLLSKIEAEKTATSLVETYREQIDAFKIKIHKYELMEEENLEMNETVKELEKTLTKIELEKAVLEEKCETMNARVAGVELYKNKYLCMKKR